MQPDLTKEDVRYFTLDPINLVFMAFFLAVMLFQVIGMLFHRIRTVGHLLSRNKWGVPEEKKERPKKEYVDSDDDDYNCYKSGPDTIDAYKDTTKSKRNVRETTHVVKLEDNTEWNEEIQSGNPCSDSETDFQTENRTHFNKKEEIVLVELVASTNSMNYVCPDIRCTLL